MTDKKLKGGFIAKLESGATLSSLEKGMAVDIANCGVYVDIAWELVSEGEMSRQKATAIESAQHELYVSFPYHFAAKLTSIL